MTAPTNAAYAATQQLLVAELDAVRFGVDDYLPWFYGANPRGAAIEENEDDEATGARIGHYAVLPTRFRTPAGVVPWIFSSNVATDSSTRRGGLFRKMAERLYERAAATGAAGMVGVGNDASTVVVVERFGWQRIAPMRARVTFPVPHRARVASHVVDEAFLASAPFESLAHDLDWVPVSGWVQSWDADFLRWRLSRPNGGYVLHESANAIAVSVRAHAPLRIPAAVLLKVFPRRGATLPVDPAPLTTAACRHHRAPFCVYAGWNAHTKVRGIPMPQRWQPSPLNVVLKVLDPARIGTEAFPLDTWELLDMDAY